MYEYTSTPGNKQFGWRLRQVVLKAETETIKRESLPQTFNDTTPQLEGDNGSSSFLKRFLL